MEWWWLNAAAQTVMVVCYAWIAMVMLKGIVAGRQWRSNPVAVAIFAVFATCTVGHRVHVEHMVGPALLPGLYGDGVTVEAARTMHGDWLSVFWHVLTAGVAIWYLSMRSRLQVVHGGQALCEDMVQKQTNAMAIHDQVMASLGRARDALDRGDRRTALLELEDGLDESRSIITQLLGERGGMNELGPGDLRRSGPA